MEKENDVMEDKWRRRGEKDVPGIFWTGFTGKETLVTQSE